MHLEYCALSADFYLCCSVYTVFLIGFCSTCTRKAVLESKAKYRIDF